MSGYIGFPASSVYVSTKFALEGLSESLSYEVEPYGIKIILIEPGVINTNFVENIAIPDNTKEISISLLLRSSSNGSIMPSAVSKTNINISTDNTTSSYPDQARHEEGVTQYSEVVKKFLSHYYPAMNNALHPKEVAIVILESINASKRPSDRGNNFFRYAVGEDAKFYAEAKRKMTDSELHSLVMKRTIS
jgi:NAD(P)-dependent dehydrogenase (short-subunit alcohol dehydrogenase family)